MFKDSPSQPRPRQNTDIGGNASSLADGLSSIFGGGNTSTDAASDSATASDSVSATGTNGTPTRPRTRTRTGTPTATASDSGVSSTDVTATDTGSTPATTETGQLTSSAVPDSTSRSNTASLTTGPSVQSPAPSEATVPAQTRPMITESSLNLEAISKSIGSSSIYTSILITTSATISGHVSVFATLVPTTLSAFPPESKTALPGSAVAGAVIGSLLAAALVIVLAFLFKRRRKARRRKAALMDARKSRGRRGIVLDDDDDEESAVPMRYTSAGSMSTSSGEAGSYPYGALGAPPSPGGASPYSTTPPDAPHMNVFAGKDPATIRAIKASKSGSASGSIFREDFGEPRSPTPSGSRHVPSPHQSHSHDRYSIASSGVGAAGGIVPMTPEILNVANRGTESPTSMTSPAPWSPQSSGHGAPQRTVSGGSGGPIPSSFYYPPAASASSLHHPPRGAASPQGPMTRNSVIVDEQFHVREREREDYFQLSRQGTASQSVSPPTRSRRRDSYVLPDLPVEGDGSMRRRERGSSVDIQPYLSEDEDGDGGGGKRRSSK